MLIKAHVWWVTACPWLSKHLVFSLGRKAQVPFEAHMIPGTVPSLQYLWGYRKIIRNFNECDKHIKDKQANATVAPAATYFVSNSIVFSRRLSQIFLWRRCGVTSNGNVFTETLQKCWCWFHHNYHGRGEAWLLCRVSFPHPVISALRGRLAFLSPVLLCLWRDRPCRNAASGGQRERGAPVVMQRGEKSTAE